MTSLPITPPKILIRESESQRSSSIEHNIFPRELPATLRTSPDTHSAKLLCAVEKAYGRKRHPDSPLRHKSPAWCGDYSPTCASMLRSAIFASRSMDYPRSHV